MKYYDSKADRIITSEELTDRYGTEFPVAELGIYYLSKQPDYVPIAFNDLLDGTWYPVESYTAMRVKAVHALVEAGLTEEEAAEAIA
jgi:hypothetical protein